MSDPLAPLVDRKTVQTELGLTRASVDVLFQSIAQREGVVVFGRKPYVTRAAVARELADRTYQDGKRVR